MPNTQSRGRRCFFIDKCLPFGHSISCALFQKFSNALAHLFKYYFRLKIEDQALFLAITNYLDDFLFAALTQMRCNDMLASFLQLCMTLGVPVAVEKTEWASTFMVFLGILLNGVRYCLVVPEEKKM